MISVSSSPIPVNIIFPRDSPLFSPITFLSVIVVTNWRKNTKYNSGLIQVNSYAKRLDVNLKTAESSCLRKNRGQYFLIPFGKKLVASCHHFSGSRENGFQLV